MDSYATITLESFPEELLERILLHAVLAPAASRVRLTKPTMIGRVGKEDQDEALTGDVALLLTSHKWHRIALPLVYHTVYLKTPGQVGLLVRTLEDGSTLRTLSGMEKGSLIRSLTVSLLSHTQLPNLLSRCTQLDALDLCLDSTTFGKPNPRCGTLSISSIPSPSSAHILSALSSIKTIRHLTVRKDPNVYLTLPKVGEFFVGLAEAVKGWDRLVEVYMAFRLSDDSVGLASIFPNTQTAPPPSTPPNTKSPLTTLTSALALSPRLESLVTHLPTVWNPVLVNLVGDDEPSSGGEFQGDSVDVDENTAACKNILKRIVLLPGMGESRPPLSRQTYPPLHAQRPTGIVPGHGLGLSIPQNPPCSSVSPSATTLICKPFPDHAPLPALPNSHYLATAAQKHPKLMKLIRAGWRDSMFGASSGENGGYGVGRGRASTWAA